MRLLIDADGCPVVNLSIERAAKAGVPVTLVCDEAHEMAREGATTITVSKGSDSADFYLVNLVEPGDVVVTQDYGLAAMCLGRRAKALSQNGLIYTEFNIDALLMSRHQSRKIRMAGGRVKGPAKREKAQDEAFLVALDRLLAGH